MTEAVFNPSRGHRLASGCPTVQMSKKLTAGLLFAATLLVSDGAVAHVVARDLVPLLEDDDRERLRDELLPIVHDCPQVAATIYTQDFTEDEFASACVALKETADRFHATMRTDPRSPLPNRNENVEILAFSNHEDKMSYYLEVYGVPDLGWGGVYHQSDDPPKIIMDHWRYPRIGSSGWGLLRHEYAHFLDGLFLGLWGPSEGLAVYFSGPTAEDGHVRPPILGDGSDLPPLLDIYRSVSWPHAEALGGLKDQYTLGYVIFAFLIQEHPDVILAIYGMYRGFFAFVQRRHLDEWIGDIEDAILPLEGDFHRWLLELVPIAVLPIEPVTVFASEEERIDGYEVRKTTWGALFLPRFFLSTQDLTYGVSLSIPYETTDPYHFSAYGSSVGISSEIVDFQLTNEDYSTYAGTDVGYDRGTLLIRNTQTLGSLEVTVTATAPDGDTAQQTFAVNVVRDLRSREIAVGDPLSLEEGRSVVYLSGYFSGPDLKEVAFSVESSDPGVALAEVEGGRLILTAVALGEAEITVRGDYLGRVREQTFTIAVTDDCPSWLCRGAFAGWRSALLPQATDASDAQTPPQTAQDR